VFYHFNFSLSSPLDELMLMFSTLSQDKQSTTFNFMHIITTPALALALVFVFWVCCSETDDVM